MDHSAIRRTTTILLPCALLSLLAGCGTTKSRSASDQLLMSDAVDRTVSQIDFHVLSGHKVYLDTTYIKPVKGIGFVNADYVISSLRQQMVAAGLLIQDDAEDADYIVEARVGALGTDGHNVTYGIPPSTGLTDAASLLSNAPRLPAIPEISLARKEDYLGAAKVAVFAYDRKTKRPVWQSGLAMATSSAKDAWVLGAGPIQYGTIYDETRFAGERIWPRWFKDKKKDTKATHRLASYYEEVDFLDSAQQPEPSKKPSDGTPRLHRIADPRLLPPGVDAAAAPIPSGQQPPAPDKPDEPPWPASSQAPTARSVPVKPPVFTPPNLPAMPPGS